MAVIKNQKTGMWEVRTYYKDWTGTRMQKTKRGFAKKSEAQEWERAFKLKDEMNINMKFKDFAELYLSDIQPRIKYNSFLTRSCSYSNIVVVGTKQRVQYLVEELRETQIVMKEITDQILSGDFSMSGESYKELKEDYLAFMITMVDILNGAAYLFDKKPDSDNRHWKEQQEIQEYCEALGKDISGKEKQVEKWM